MPRPFRSPGPDLKQGPSSAGFGYGAVTTLLPPGDPAEPAARMIEGTGQSRCRANSAGNKAIFSVAILPKWFHEHEMIGLWQVPSARGMSWRTSSSLTRETVKRSLRPLVRFFCCLEFGTCFGVVASISLLLYIMFLLAFVRSWGLRFGRKPLTTSCETYV